MKKLNFAALILSVLTLVMLAVPAAAAASNSTVIDADLLLPDITISVTVPANSNVYINPFELPIEVGQTMETSQIISDPCHIENRSVVPVSVTVSAEAAIKKGSEMMLRAATTEGWNSKIKGAFVYFEMKATSDPDNVTWDSTFDKSKHLLIRDWEQIKKDMVILGAGGKEKCYGAFRLTGDCIQIPYEPWTEADGFDVTLRFTFKPLSTTTVIP